MARLENLTRSPHRRFEDLVKRIDFCGLLMHSVMVIGGDLLAVLAGRLTDIL